MQVSLAQHYREKFEKLTAWHRWFAWRPVSIGENQYAWLEFVERRSEFLGAYDGVYRFNYYRARQNGDPPDSRAVA